MNKILKILDLCSGLGGFSEAFIERGHFVMRIDNDARFSDIKNTIIFDINHLDWWMDFDVILVAPPCDTFSVASISTHWMGGVRAYEPKTTKCKEMIELIKQCLETIHHLEPQLYFIENPRGVLRKLELMEGLPRKTVTYCQYGENRMKPTDIWTNSKEWEPRPMCKNGDSCHERAPRGAKTGTQGLKNSALRALIPYELSLEICLACESEIVK